MPSYNRVTLMGNLTRGIEFRELRNRNDVPVTIASTGIAVNGRRRDGDGAWRDDPLFIELTFFGRTASIAQEHLGKGSLVLVEGRLQLERWTTKDGEQRSRIRVIGERMQMLGEPKGKTGPVKTTEAVEVVEPVVTTSSAADDPPF